MLFFLPKQTSKQPKNALTLSEHPCHVRFFEIFSRSTLSSHEGRRPPIQVLQYPTCLLVFEKWHLLPQYLLFYSTLSLICVIILWDPCLIQFKTSNEQKVQQGRFGSPLQTEHNTHTHATFKTYPQP